MLKSALSDRVTVTFDLNTYTTGFTFRDKHFCQVRTFHNFSFLN